MGYVPALEILPGQFLCESIAILEYLEETNPAPHLLPKDPLDRAQVRQLVETINAGTQPLQNTIVAPLYSENLENQKKWNQTWIRKGLRAYEILAKGQAGEFSWGNTLTLADLVLIPQCYNAIRQGLSLAEFPLIESIYNHASKTESFQISAPERFQP
jgi:maleylacetoacetate isomerase